MEESRGKRGCSFGGGGSVTTSFPVWVMGRPLVTKTREAAESGRSAVLRGTLGVREGKSDWGMATPG